MKKICEIYDVSAEYEQKENSVLIVVSDLSKENLCNAVPELKNYISNIMNTECWGDFIKINRTYESNNDKYRIRTERHSQYDRFECPTTIASDVENELENKELNEHIAYALSLLKEQPRRRFLKHYQYHLSYQEIAVEDGRNVKTINESIQGARKKFLKNFSEPPQ